MRVRNGIQSSRIKSFFGQANFLTRILSWALLYLLLQSRCGDCADLILDKVQLDDVPFAEACARIHAEACRKQPGIKFEFDFTPPDPRCSALTNSPDKKITLNLRDIPLIDVLRLICPGSTVEIDRSVARIKDARRGFLYVSVTTELSVPFVFFENYDRRIKLDGKPMRAIELMGLISKTTGEALNFDAELEGHLKSTAIALPAGESQSFLVLKSLVAAMSKAAGKEVIIFAREGYARELCIGIKTSDIPDVRAVFPFFSDVKGSSRKGRLQWWDPPPDEDAFARMISEAKGWFGYSDTFYEPTMNCFWLIGEYNNVAHVSTFDMVPGDSSHSYHIEIGRDAEPIIHERPKHDFFPKK